MKENRQVNTMTETADQAGLTEHQAEQLLLRFGPNEITEKQTRPLVQLGKHFWGPIPWMIEAAIVLSAIIGDWANFAVITVLLLLNAGVGFWQEHKADHAIALLKQKLAPMATVKRDGAWHTLPARELVPGDVVRIRAGDVVPADVDVLQGTMISIDESTLTGESLPVSKEVGDNAYASSVLVAGEMTAVVTKTGSNTYFGKTAQLVEEVHPQSHFQQAIMRIGTYVLWFAFLLLIIIFIVAGLHHDGILQTIAFALVLTVAAIPAALPAVLSVAMAVGALTLARQQAIVSRLSAIEELAGMDVLCSDKTGTITKNELQVDEIVSVGAFSQDEVLLFAVLATEREHQTPIEHALQTQATEQHLSERLHRATVTKFLPFDPVHKRTEAAVEDAAGDHFSVSLGAPQAILSLGSFAEAVTELVREQTERYAEKGLRTLGVAHRGAEGTWQYAGLIALYDPPRADSKRTIQDARDGGLTVKMITGDHVAVSREIAREVGLGTDIIEASAIAQVSDQEATKLAETTDGFAQVFPAHKYRIVELLQKQGHIVGMTGDGVNDAPALKQADVGIAVAGATDAAKSAAAIVLTSPGLSVITSAIVESRKIFQRMTQYAVYRMAETIRVLLFITLAVALFNDYPVTALMIVLLAILNDVPIMTMAYDRVVYARTPTRWQMKKVLGAATVLGVIGVVSSFGMLYLGREVFGLSPELLQSLIYLKLSIAGHLTVFAARTEGPFWSVLPAPQLFFAVITTQIIATLIVVYGVMLPALGWTLALMVWGYALGAFLVTDAIKVAFYKFIQTKPA